MIAKRGMYLREAISEAEGISLTEDKEVAKVYENSQPCLWSLGYSPKPYTVRLTLVAVCRHATLRLFSHLSAV
jgi:hypothetical protein